jgi:hypothetical protein
MAGHLKHEDRAKSDEQVKHDALGKRETPALHVGMQVWFVPYREGAEELPHLAATVTKVNEDGTANLCVFTEAGSTQGHQTIPLAKDDDDAPESDFCCLMNAEGKKPKKVKK